MASTLNFTLTDTAQTRLAGFLEAEGSSGQPIRIVARRRGYRFEYAMDFAGDDAPDPADQVLVQGDVTLWIDEASAGNLDGATLDYVTGLNDAGFRFDNPQEQAVLLANPVVARIQTVLDEEINPFVQGHGGHIDLVDFKEGTAYVEMRGGCQGCGMAAATLSQGVEERLKARVPEVEIVVDTTDHAAGQSPYQR